ncbi:hypothetical protein Daus18300_005737 [Diaporthe australafricana]|uniref:Uncharacterized protein n=1 Tax=Diaporthe australafricana TaxID=127596 RepID=A0ABR3WZM3_9PEZI
MPRLSDKSFLSLCHDDPVLYWTRSWAISSHVQEFVDGANVRSENHQAYKDRCVSREQVEPPARIKTPGAGTGGISHPIITSHNSEQNNAE